MEGWFRWWAGGRRGSVVSASPDLGEWVVQVNLLSARGGASASCCIQSVESQRDGVQRHHLQIGISTPKERPVRAYTPKNVSREGRGVG